MQGDLFPLPVIGPPTGPDGVDFGEAIISTTEEESLIAAVDSLPLAPFRFQGWLGKRLTHSFGWNYDFDRGEATVATPIPDWLLPLRDKAADFAGLAAHDLSQALLTRYDPGAGIGWHRDRPIFENIIGISLGAFSTLRLRHRTGEGFERARLGLPPRSIYHLHGDARHIWEHGIAPMEERRWSITFRSLSAKGRRLLLP